MQMLRWHPRTTESETLNPIFYQADHIILTHSELWEPLIYTSGTPWTSSIASSGGSLEMEILRPQSRIAFWQDLQVIHTHLMVCEALFPLLPSFLNPPNWNLPSQVVKWPLLPNGPLSGLATDTVNTFPFSKQLQPRVPVSTFYSFFLYSIYLLIFKYSCFIYLAAPGLSWGIWDL